MSVEELQEFSSTYEDIYFGKSDKDFVKLMLDAVIDALVKSTTKVDELDAKVDALEVRVDALES